MIAHGAPCLNSSLIFELFVSMRLFLIALPEVSQQQRETVTITPRGLIRHTITFDCCQQILD